MDIEFYTLEGCILVGPKVCVREGHQVEDDGEGFRMYSRKVILEEHVGYAQEE